MSKFNHNGVSYDTSDWTIYLKPEKKELPTLSPRPKRLIKEEVRQQEAQFSLSPGNFKLADLLWNIPKEKWEGLGFEIDAESEGDTESNYNLFSELNVVIYSVLSEEEPNPEYYSKLPECEKEERRYNKVVRWNRHLIEAWTLWCKKQEEFKNKNSEEYKKQKQIEEAKALLRKYGEM